MRTRTIYQALDCVRESSAFFATEKRVRQAGTFERELLRRMDERDAVIPAARHAADAHFGWVLSDDQQERQAVMEWDAAMMEIHSAFVGQARHK